VAFRVLGHPVHLPPPPFTALILLTTLPPWWLTFRYTSQAHPHHRAFALVFPFDALNSYMINSTFYIPYQCMFPDYSIKNNTSFHILHSHPFLSYHLTKSLLLLFYLLPMFQNVNSYVSFFLLTFSIFPVAKIYWEKWSHSLYIKWVIYSGIKEMFEKYVIPIMELIIVIKIEMIFNNIGNTCVLLLSVKRENTKFLPLKNYG
jgi:hypothetical protein